MDMWTKETDRWAQELEDARGWLKDTVEELIPHLDKKPSDWDWLRQMGNADSERYQRRFVYKRETP